VQCEFLQLPVFLTPGLLDFEFCNSPIHSSPLTISARPKAFFFSRFFSSTKFTFQKEKLAKSSFLNASENHENFFFNRCVIKYYAISHGHIGDGYREIQEIGTHRRILQTLVGAVGSAMNVCSRS
jgi:hypothetical protein